MSFAPTPEQTAAVDLACKGGHLAIEALAGTGKTSTLKLIAEALDGRGTYLAFNKAIVTEAQAKFPGTVACSTAHSLAFRAVGKNYAHRLKAPRMRSLEIARVLGIDDLMVTTSEGSRRLAAGWLAGLVMRGVGIYCQTADPEPTRGHIPRPRPKRLKGEEVDAGGPLDEVWDDVKAYLETPLRRAWADLSKTEGRLQFTHNCYLKLWQLQGPRIGSDFILFDEAQDANPVMLSIVEAQRGHAQLIFVGDRHQQIYGWNGAVNAMEKAPVDGRTYLTHCQPAGTMVRQAVQVNGREWQHRDVPIEALAVGDTVASWYRRGVRRKGQSITDIAVRNYDGPLVVAQAAGQTSRYAPNHECVVVLGDLTEGDQVVYMMRKGDQYRIGRCPWKYGNGHGPIRRAVREGAEAVWVLSVHETVEQAALHEALAQTRFGIPGAGWREDAHYKMPLDEFWAKIGDNGQQAVACLVAHRLLPDMPLWTRGDRPGGGWSTQLVTAAANVRSGMRMAVVDSMSGSTNGAPGGFVPWSGWTPVEITTEWYCGPIYSLSVAVDHTYIGDGIVTHNSFRFGPEIAEEANRVLEHLGDVRIVGRAPAGTVGPIDRPDIILSRTNASAVGAAFAELDRGGRPHIVGGADDVVSFARAAASLLAGRRTEHPEIGCFDTWQEVRDYVRQDELGSDLQLLVKLVDDFGADRIVSAFDRQPREDQATLVLSTAHKSKGREWGKVQLAGDFSPEPEGEELRLLYVAATRAERELDTEGVGFLHESAPAAPEEPETAPEAPAAPVVAEKVTTGLVHVHELRR